MSLRVCAAPALAAVIVMLWPHAAFAAEGSGGLIFGNAEPIFILEVVVLLLIGRALGEAMQRIGQPAVVGQLLAGILLGASVFGLFWPQAQHALFPDTPEQKAMIGGVSELGILLLLLLTGMETDLKLIASARKTAFTISATGIAVPFACGFALGEFLPDGILPAGVGRLVPSLFLGTALSISSVKIVAMVVRDMNFMRRNLGQIMVASAIIEDSIGWVIIAIIFGIAQTGSLDLMHLGRTLLGVALFLGFSFTLGRTLVFRFIRWSNDSFQSEFSVITAILIVMGVMSLITYCLGVQTILGAFVAGILVGESPILTKHIEEELRGLVAALFAPIFFALSGLHADFSIFAHAELVWVVLAFIAIASFGKFAGAFVGGELGGLSFRESVALGTGMNARGSTDVIVATIGLSMGALTQNLFTMIVTMAVVTTMMMPPLLRWALARLPITAAEKKRLAREAMDEKGFVPNLERLLLAVDDSANGHVAAHLAGSLVGSRGMPVTLVHLDKGKVVAPPENESGEARDQPHERALKTGAKASAVATGEGPEAKPRKIDITHHEEKANAPDAVAAASRKGFDLMLVGLGRMRDDEGNFTREVSRLTEGFEGVVALLVPDVTREAAVPDAECRLLLPVTGTEASRRAAELAAVLARPSGAAVAALFVSAPGAARRDRSRRREEAVLKDIVRLGQRYEIDVETRIAHGETVEGQILQMADRKRDLIVIGVSRRSGESLFLGNTASALLKKWKGAILLVAS